MPRIVRWSTGYRHKSRAKLVLEHMDIAAAAEMPRAAFEAQLTWLGQGACWPRPRSSLFNFAEQRELVEMLVADMLGSSACSNR